MLFAQAIPVTMRCHSAAARAAERILETGRWMMRLEVGPWIVQQAVARGPGTMWMQGQRDALGEAGEAGTGTGSKAGDEAAFDPKSYHKPVLPNEVVEYLQPGPGKLFLDATLGGGGHSELLLEAGAEVVALDQDAEALAHARQRLTGHGDRFRAFQTNFRDFPSVLAKAGIGKLDGILADLGVSSRQLDNAARGFSFMNDGPLDMRMNPEEGRSAADLVNEADARELERVLWDLGEERNSRRIVRAIIERRARQPFQTTADLAGVIASVVPRYGKTHPATQSFQAIRIAVNEELTVLAEFLAHVPQWLKPGGRAAMISFHSMEDRMVKQAFVRCSTEWLDRPEWPEPRRNPDHSLCLVTRKPVEAAEAEVKSNPRARSAKLRVAERIQP